MSKVIKAIGVAGVVAGGAYLLNSENRRKAKENLTNMAIKFNESYLNSGQTKDAKDAKKMVAEGGLTSIRYFNELQEELAEKSNEQ